MWELLDPVPAGLSRPGRASPSRSTASPRDGAGPGADAAGEEQATAVGARGATRSAPSPSAASPLTVMLAISDAEGGHRVDGWVAPGGRREHRGPDVARGRAASSATTRDGSRCRSSRRGTSSSCRRWGPGPAAAREGRHPRPHPLSAAGDDDAPASGVRPAGCGRWPCPSGLGVRTPGGPARRCRRLVTGHEYQRQAPAGWSATLLRGGVPRVRTRLPPSGAGKRGPSVRAPVTTGGPHDRLSRLRPRPRPTGCTDAPLGGGGRVTPPGLLSERRRPLRT